MKILPKKRYINPKIYAALEKKFNNDQMEIILTRREEELIEKAKEVNAKIEDLQYCWENLKESEKADEDEQLRRFYLIDQNYLLNQNLCDFIIIKRTKFPPQCAEFLKERRKDRIKLVLEDIPKIRNKIVGIVNEEKLKQRDLLNRILAIRKAIKKMENELKEN
ncbi:MAG: hypothetical protein Ta2E_10630 [Mycoplasmoidaceae bacterium]|nr:MAG: hypothetical protein Ta2E_10630 [Mycoplasmoidaceae bacterium]